MQPAASAQVLGFSPPLPELRIWVKACADAALAWGVVRAGARLCRNKACPPQAVVLAWYAKT